MSVQSCEKGTTSESVRKEIKLNACQCIRYLTSTARSLGSRRLGLFQSGCRSGLLLYRGAAPALGYLLGHGLRALGLGKPARHMGMPRRPHLAIIPHILLPVQRFPLFCFCTEEAAAILEDRHALG